MTINKCGYMYMHWINLSITLQNSSLKTRGIKGPIMLTRVFCLYRHVHNIRSVKIETKLKVKPLKQFWLKVTHKPFCDFFSKLMQWLIRKKSILHFFYVLLISHIVQWSKTIWAILFEGYTTCWNISMKLI